MSIVDKINCPHCGAPVPFEPGEILATCKYCGFTAVIETGTVFTFEHSMLLNEFDPVKIEESIRSWMGSGFLKPPDLERKSKTLEKQLIYLPFWVVSAEVTTTYKGIFERIAPAITKEGKLEKSYDWLVLARKATEFPTRAYDVPLEGKIAYDFRRIEAFAKVLNSEIRKDEAAVLAKQQIEEHHRYLLKQDVDRIIEMDSEVKVEQTVYLHAPVWFIKYEYKREIYQLLIDGATGTAIKGDIPAHRF
jgi:hypothetical protein